MAAKLVSVITPAYQAHSTIARAIASVQAQEYARWEMIVIVDDGLDYTVDDPRVRVVSSGGMATGAAAARNVGMAAAQGDVITLLDADDAFLPGKLARMVPLAMEYGMASCALRLVDAQGKLLRLVGSGDDRLLDAAQYKAVNFSCDSMLVFRRDLGLRYDEGFRVLEDVELVLQFFFRHAQVAHIGTPLQDYTKHAASVSYAPSAASQYAEAKRALIARLEAGYYALPDTAKQSWLRFFTASLTAESQFADGRERLFEDYLAPLL